MEDRNKYESSKIKDDLLGLNHKKKDAEIFAHDFINYSFYKQACRSPVLCHAFLCNL